MMFRNLLDPEIIFQNRLANIENLQLRLRRYFIRSIEERQDEYLKEDNSNQNFMCEKDMNYRLYPFYINWKKIEANEEGFYRIYLHFGYFGASIYSSFKEKYHNLDVNNVLYVLANFIFEYLLSDNNKNEESQNLIKEFFEKMQKIEKIGELIQNKIIMMKEVSMILLILKIYEIYFILQKSKNDIENTLKYEFLLVNYLTDDDYKEIYKNRYKGKVSKIFKKIVEKHGKDYELAKTKQKLIEHIKSIYKKNNP